MNNDNNPTPITLPTVDELAQMIWLRDGNTIVPRSWHHSAAQDVLDLIAGRMPVWQPVKPGTVIKAGTRWRTGGNDWVEERVSSFDRTVDDSAPVFIDPRTIPGPDPTERIRQALDSATDPIVSLDAADVRDLLARLDRLEADR